MEITEVRVKRIPPGQGHPSHPLHAVCAICLDGVFVVHELKVVGNPPFVVMPNRRAYSRCPDCDWKNGCDHRYCCGCGRRLPPPDLVFNEKTGRPILYYDLAHPIEQSFRTRISEAVVGAVFSGHPCVEIPVP